MSQKTGEASDAFSDLFGLPQELVDALIQRSELWIACGQNLRSYEFITQFARGLRAEYPGVPDEPFQKVEPHRFGFGINFAKSVSQLKEKIKAAQEARRKDYAKEWKTNLQQLAGQLQFKPECVFCAMELGFILSKTKGPIEESEKGPAKEPIKRSTKRATKESLATTTRRPRMGPDYQEDRDIASAIVLTSMAEEFFPLSVVIKGKEDTFPAQSFNSNVKVRKNQQGWASGQDWTDWLLQDFDDQTKSFATGDDSWRLLFVDDFRSPRRQSDATFFSLCYSRKILCVATPRNCSQPVLRTLDPFLAGTLASLTRAYESFLEEKCDPEDSTLRPEEIIDFFSQLTLGEKRQKRRLETRRAWQNTATSSILRKALRNETESCQTLTTPGKRGRSDSVDDNNLDDTDVERVMISFYDQGLGFGESDYYESSPSRMLDFQARSSSTLLSSPSGGRNRPIIKAASTERNRPTDSQIDNQLDNLVQDSARRDGSDGESDDCVIVDPSDLPSPPLPDRSSPAGDRTVDLPPLPAEGPRQLARRNYNDALDEREKSSPGSKKVRRIHMNNCRHIYDAMVGVDED